MKPFITAKKFAIEVMNKTQNILEKLAQTSLLQKNANNNIKEAGKVVGQIADLMSQMTAKLNDAGTGFSEIAANGARVRGETDGLAAKFRQNRAELTTAENEYARATAKMVDVENAKVVVGDKYNETAGKFSDKQKQLDDVLKRIADLNARAQNAVGDIADKTRLVTDLTEKYKSNEKEAIDLSKLIKKLTIKALHTRNRLQELSKCHATCNPRLKTFCEVELAKVDKEEQAAFAAL